MVSQNILNLVDTAMVGTLGDAALGAVGLGGFIMFMCQAIILGLSPAVQAMAARRVGEDRINESAGALNAGLLLSVIGGLALTIALWPLMPTLFGALNEDPAVVDLGSRYVQIRCLAILFVGMNFSFRGYWNAIDRPQLYMQTLVFMHITNIALNYTLIFGKFGMPEMGVAGAATGTTISTALGSAYYFLLGFRHARKNGFLTERPSAENLKTCIRIGFPNGVQQFFFAAGFTIMFWIIGLVGTTELAAASVLINLMLVAILPGIAMGIAAASLVGQALGRGDADDARSWGWDVVKVAAVIMGCLGAPLALFPDLILSGFIHDPVTLDVARLPLRIIGLAIGFESVGLVLMNALLGAGDSRRVMVVSVGAQYLLFLPAAYVIGPVLGYGLLGIWIAMFAQRLGQGLVFVGFWMNDNWTSIKV